MYSIYHIPGVKVGCTDDYERRSKNNKNKYGSDIVLILLQVVQDIDSADILENEWSLRLGYGEIKPQERYKFAIERQVKSRAKWVHDKKTETKKGRKYPKISEARRGKKVPKQKQAMTGKRRGPYYRDDFSGYVGTLTDIALKYSTSASNAIQRIKYGKPVVKGPMKGTFFKLIDYPN